jgi:hypothetical protein
VGGGGGGGGGGWVGVGVGVGVGETEIKTKLSLKLNLKLGNKFSYGQFVISHHSFASNDHCKVAIKQKLSNLNNVHFVNLFISQP